MNIGDDRGEYVHIVCKPAPALPIHIAGDALAEELAPMRAGEGADMRVGEMGEKKAHDVFLAPGLEGVKAATPCSA
jgi:hypothetical protein